MALKADIKTTFEPSRVIQPIYTGGSVTLSEDGKILATCLADEALLTNLDSGEHLARIEGDGEPITTLCLTPDASYLILCSRSLSMRIYVLQASESGIEAKLARTLKPHTTPVVTSAVDSTSSLLATGGADGVVKVWDLRGGYVTHTFHGHSGVISALRFFQVDAHVEERSSSGKKRKSWQRDNDGAEAVQDAATAGFRLASGGEDGKIRVWDLHKRKSVATLDSHASVVRSLDYSPELASLLSGSRDKTVIVWDARTWQIRSTVPVLEGVESAGFIASASLFYTGGESGRIRVWSTESGSEITEAQTAGVETEAVVDVLHSPSLPFLLSIHADQTLILHSLASVQSLPSERIPPLTIIRRISGTHDEVIDLAYIGPERNMLALATNLEDIRLISLDANASTRSQQDSSPSPSSYFGADVALLKGHDDIIITIDTDWSGHWLATGAKDNTAKLWRLDPAQNSYTCFATFTGHAESIGAVALPNAAPPVGSKEYEHSLEHPPKYMITGSQDKTVKRWDISAQAGKAPKAAYTRKAHDKDINAIETSYTSTSSSSLFASASQDRTVKIWDVETGDAIGVLRGHKRGVWSVAFSPPGTPALTTNGIGGAASSAKGLLVSGSGDKTVRIWSLADYSCLRTFEGHANSVLKVVWLPNDGGGGGRAKRAVQIASAAGDGLVKVWDAQGGECAATLDNHVDRVWALAVKPSARSSLSAERQVRDGEMGEGNGEDTTNVESSTLELVSGSADSTLTFWTDTTASTALQASTQATARIEQDQELQNLIRGANYREAIVLALQLNHPKRLLDLFTAVVNGPWDRGSFTGRNEVDAVLAGLSDGQLWLLLRRVRDWNANGRTHGVAQRVLYAVLRLVPRERVLGLLRRRRGMGGGREGEVDEELVDALAELSTRERGKEKESVRDLLDGLRVYTERHFARLEQTSEERFVLLWALQQMGDVGGGGIETQDGGMASNGMTNGHGYRGSEREQDVLMLDS